MLKILSALLVISIAYLWFRMDMYLWFCEQESSSAACTVVGMMNEKQNYLDSADSYYDKACGLDYALACFKRGELAQRRNQKELAKQSFERACKLGHQLACGTL